MGNPNSYVMTASLVHRVDARVKIAFLLLVSIFIFAAKPLTLSGIALFVILIFLKTGARARTIVLTLKPALPIFIVIIGVHTLFGGGERFAIGDFASLAVGFHKGLLLVARFALLIMASAIITRTSTPLEMSAALEFILAPLRMLSLPVGALAQTISLAIRFFPQLLGDLQDIQEMQKARGMDMKGVPLRRKLHLANSTIVALLDNTIGRIEDIAAAMEARGYGSGAIRTRLHPLRMRNGDYLLLAVMFLLAIISWISVEI